MPILVKHDGKFYEISDEVLARSVIPKDQFERRVRGLETELMAKGSGGVSQYNFMDLSNLPEEDELPSATPNPGAGYAD